MRQIIAILFLILINSSCKSPSEDLTTIEGNYIYFDDAAVLQTKNEIYGVFLTKQALELNKKADALKTNPNDIIYVKIKGIVTTKKDKKILWDKKLEIIEIESINSKKEVNNALILGSN